MTTPAAPEDVYDYVVVGGGSAGCVVASRLSEDPSVSVCLVEAGPKDSHPLIHVPVGMLGLINHKQLGWGYSSEPQRGLFGRRFPVPRGRTLGGSGAINGMVYTRGHRLDFDDWRAAGNPGWGYEDVLPYFTRSEDNLDLGAPYHGRGGPLTVATVRQPNRLTGSFLRAAAEQGHTLNDDPNGAEQDGFGLRQVNIRRGRRVTAATAFLRPAAGRSNLHVRTGLDVSHVTIENRRATGIMVSTAGVTRAVRARREVVLCAGSFGSPAILMRSGLGDGGALSDMGIAVTQHLPGVGRNLVDHPSSQIICTGSTSHSYGVSFAALPRLALAVADYALRRRGLLASNVFEAAGYIRTQPGLDRPDVQLVFCPALRKPGGTLGIGHGFAIGVVALHPRSRGSVRLSGPRPENSPLIDFGLFDDTADVATIARGLQAARNLAASEAFSPYRAGELLPGAEVTSPQELADFARRTAATAFHPVGTCRMGIDGDAVVDPELKVKGIEGLRVADASIMPTIVGGNTNAAVIMIAEKASDMMRKSMNAT